MKAISCIYNLRCDSPFSSHKKAKSSLIPTFPYLHIFVFLYFRISIHSRSAKLRRNPDAGFSDILVSGCSRTRRMIWPDIAQNPTTPKTKKQAMSVQSIRRVREPSEHGYGKGGVRVSPQPPPHISPLYNSPIYAIISFLTL